ncbi:23S rRNA (guanosine(2251)-2'-O)-methyltransferase RlmB [Halopseudomonas phragmitis]|uniref:23S rRNA (guanosine-2'-O-)-methyltransferase RlmB n=2 Tax=Pseudomonadaceae TaxID=135621 RepID=A0A1V0B4M4_9GAMM|nr:MULTISPECIES: 23S rRNA (guanosine(2251)-2'-O)-methyltransferase RlmB [Pseudomonadaceae]AQZ94867.1 23S rRNA (guanosine(2251)-2'-O)-methyltransferase RlmB [Halopseudomonas phragmitis]RHW23028.1 23S rRNA (guanosine(2251)-2'-O)-methyltransferase RlmB [Pseudomonas jilinensis]
MSDKEYVFGLHAVQALLQRNPKRVKRLLLQRGRLDGRVQAVVDLAESQGLKLERVGADELEQLADGVHQGVVAEVAPSQLWSEEMLGHLLDKLDTPALLLVLDGVTDPHNLGACLRSADAAGAQAVIIPKDRSAGLTPVVRKVACGAAETVPLVAVTNLARTLKQLQQRGLWVVGAAGEAEQLIYQVDMSVPTVIVMGAEGSGLRRLTREHCDFLAKLPMAGSVSSLNVSVATGICLFEAVRQRSQP